jgi:prepilin-type N-terminal cleavage/methylation domain-containing protein
MASRKGIQGFTLIELSIVLVIIGLVVAGILTGHDLIESATIRMQVAQLERYNTAVNTFRNKYGGIPGDLALNPASQFGFVITGCDGTAAKRDGNGLIDGFPPPGQYSQARNETALFWEDLSASGLIDAVIPNGGGPAVICGQYPYVLSLTPGTAYVGDYFPQAKIGEGNYIYVYEANGSNWFGLLGIQSTDTSGSFNSMGGGSNEPISVMQAYKMDSKADDGLPMTGNILDAAVINSNAYGIGMNIHQYDDAGSCGHNTPSTLYSITYNGGTGLNCALSFRMQ